MWQKPKNSFDRLKSFRRREIRDRIFIVPSLAGVGFFFFTFASYTLSFFDGNSGLASLAFSAFALLMVSIWLTHRNLSEFEINPEGRLKNQSVNPKGGVRMDGAELPTIPARGELKLPRLNRRPRHRFSTFFPSGLAYAWTFRKPVAEQSTDWGERAPFERHSPWARVDWKRWARTKRFDLRPGEEAISARPAARAAPREIKTHDAATWAYLWSLGLLLIFATAVFTYTPQGLILGLWLWLGASLTAFAVRAKKRYAGFWNFFFAWAALIVLMVFAKGDLGTWAAALATGALLLTPFALYVEADSAQDLAKRLRSITPPVGLFLVLLYAAQMYWPKNQRLWGDYFFDESGSALNWGNSSNEFAHGFSLAEHFLPSGRWLYWTDFPPPLRREYANRLPYWREHTFERSRGGLDWFSEANPRDLGTLTRLTRMHAPAGVDGHAIPKAAALWREPPDHSAGLTLSATDGPPPKTNVPRGASTYLIELVNSWRLEPAHAARSAQRVMTWMAQRRFRYSLSPGRMTDLDDFLFKKKIGLCQHYAGALAYLLRLGGIPARVVTGYQGGELSPWGDSLMIRDSDAHAWVEVWEPRQRSWVLLDPTFVLFPEQSSASPRPDWLNSLSWWGLRAQRTAADFFRQPRYLGLILCAFGLGCAFIARRKGRWPRSAGRSTGLTPPPERVGAWERRVTRLYASARYDFEGLETYFNRVTLHAPATAARTELETELRSLNRDLYASRADDFVK